MSFTKEQAILKAIEIYKKPVSIDDDLIKEAMSKDSLDEAAQIIADESYFWDSWPEM